MEGSGRWIDGVKFPASKLELIDTAADANAPQEVVERLQQLEREQYESRKELEQELGGGL
jgi:uncharacterized protein DUF2795